MSIDSSRLVFLVATVVAVTVAMAGSAAGEQPIVTTDLLNIRTVRDIDVSRHDRFAILSVESIGRTTGRDRDEPSYDKRRHLYRLDLTADGATPRQLTHGDRQDRSPAISPDGRAVAFLRGDETDDDDDSAQVWLLPLDGGEARQITHFEHGATDPQWCPTGTALLVRSALPVDDIATRAEADRPDNGRPVPPWSLERPGRAWFDVDRDVAPRPAGTRAEIRAWLERNTGDGDPTVITGLTFQRESSLRTELTYEQLFLIELERGEAGLDTIGEPNQITAAFHDHEDARFSPDSRHIYYSARTSTDAHLDRIERSDLWRINRDGSNATRVLSLDAWSVEQPRPSRDGSLIAFRASHLAEPNYRQDRLGLIPADGDGADGERADGAAEDEVVWLTDESFDRPVRRFAWRPARTEILFTSADHGAFPLMRTSPGLLDPDVVVERRHDMPIGVHELAAGSGAVVYTETSPQNPCVVRVRDAEGDRLAWDLNEWVASRTLARPRAETLTRPDGTEVQYWVLEPTGFVEGEQYPLVLQVHGGPHIMWGPGERTMWHEFQLFCAWGYGVVYANPRGSSGYGEAFQRGNHRNWGEGPAGDVLAAVDRCLLLDWVDDERLVLTGGSYGGYLTAWIVGHDHRFKAAVAQRGVYELGTFFGEGNAWRLLEKATGVRPFDARAGDILRQLNPLTYVQRMRTPLLIMHASDDLRTGVSQSEMLYRSLKVLGRPVEYVRYPNADHGLSRTGDPHQRMDRLNRIIEFFERHIDNDRPAPRLDDAEDGDADDGRAASDREAE